MYNRILKRPMFRRGGSSFQSQGTGITSPYDTPRRGLVQYPGGYAGERTFEDIQTDREAIFETPKGTWINDVIGSLGKYSTPYKEDGSAKTIGEMGAEQAEGLKLIRKERKDTQDLAKLTGLEKEEEGLVRDEEQANQVALVKLESSLGKETALAVQELQNAGAIDIAKIQFDPARTATGLKIKELRGMLEKGIIEEGEFTSRLKDILSGTSTGKDVNAIAAALITSGQAGPADAAKQALKIYLIIQAGISMKKGGRVGYQMGTPQTGAMPVQQASLTETIDTPTEDITETETVTEGQQGSVQMPYQEFRAALPAEVSDDIVQLIYYNQDAFADFAQITTQADVYAFNNKYGVSLVLPMDTETT